MYEVGVLLDEDLDVDALKSIRRLFGGVDREHACIVAWDMTAQDDVFRLKRAAERIGTDLVINEIRRQVRATPLITETTNHVRMEGWVFKAGYGDGCEIIIFQRTVDTLELTDGLRMRRRRPTDPAEWFEDA